MRTVISACLTVLMIAGLAVAQKKPWTEWTKKDVDKTLNDSAWGQTQTEGGGGGGSQSNESAITQVAAQRSAERQLSNSRGESGETKPTAYVKYQVRFLSAKPVREAFARQVLMSKPEPDENLTNELQGFINRDFADYIVISVGVEVGDAKMAGPIMQAFSGATAEALKEKVYLERKDGKKVFLEAYRAPVQDGMGAKFIFKRVVDGQPFLSENDNVRFVAQFNEKMKLNTRYKLSEMQYDGKLEY